MSANILTEIYYYQEEFQPGFDYGNYWLSIDADNPPASWTYAQGPSADVFLNAFRVSEQKLQRLLIIAHSADSDYRMERSDHIVLLFQDLMSIKPLRTDDVELSLHIGRDPGANRLYMRTETVAMPPWFDNTEMQTLLNGTGVRLEEPARWGRRFDPDLEWWFVYFDKVTQKAVQESHDRVMIVREWLYQAYGSMFRSGDRILKQQVRQLKEKGWRKVIADSARMEKNRRATA